MFATFSKYMKINWITIPDWPQVGGLSGWLSRRQNACQVLSGVIDGLDQETRSMSKGGRDRAKNGPSFVTCFHIFNFHGKQFDFTTFCLSVDFTPFTLAEISILLSKNQHFTFHPSARDLNDSQQWPLKIHAGLVKLWSQNQCFFGSGFGGGRRQKSLHRSQGMDLFSEQRSNSKRNLLIKLF